ncbi:MAG TPA: DnaJ domain-containing protein [Caulobacteraceae bacterium]
MRADEDLYLILGVAKNADVNDIRAAYRRAAKTAHPDQGGSNEAFLRLQRAAELLLAELQTRGLAGAGSAHRAGDRTSAVRDWTEISDELAADWGLPLGPVTIFAPQRLGLTPFVTATSLNLPAYNWLVRTAGPRGEAWDFHIAGALTRIFFRRADDARLFKLKFP